MSVLHFWRWESATYDAGTDRVASGGDSTPTAAGSPTIVAGANCGVGTNGARFITGATYRFDTSTNIVNRLEGSFGCLFVKRSGSPAGQWLQIRGGASAADQYFIRFIGTDEIQFGVGDPDGTPVVASTTAANLVVDTVYGLVARWVNNGSGAGTIRLEIYGTPVSGRTLIEGISNTSGFTAPASLAASDRYRLGDVGGAGVLIDLKNTFLSDDYDEPIQANFGITDFDNFTIPGAAVTGTGAATAPLPTVAGTAARGLHDRPGAIALTMSMPTVSGVGEVTHAGPVEVTGTGALEGPSPTVEGTGIRRVRGTGALVAPKATVAGSQGPRAITGTGALVCGLPQIVASGIRHITGTGALTSPRYFVNGLGAGVTFGDMVQHRSPRKPGHKRSIKYAHGRYGHG